MGATPNFRALLADIRRVDAEEADRREIDALQINLRGSDRWAEVMADELADQRADERRDAMESGA